MRKTLLKLLPLALGLNLTACGSILGPVSQRPITMYEINDVSVQGNVNCPESTPSDVLYISPMQANAPFDSNKMYYSPKPFELDSFGYSQWVSLPTDMLMQSITKKVLLSCAYKGVVTSNALADSNYRLVTKLISLRQKVNTESGTAEVNLVIYSELIDLERNSIISSNVFVESMPSKQGPLAMVDSVNQLTAKFDNELLVWLKKNTK
jgi:ABC-type uncharacterized transport system auxiliary subunit